MRGYIPPVDADEQLFFKRVCGMAHTAHQRGVPVFTQFCTDREQVLAEAALAHEVHTAFCFDGGFDGAERKVLCVYDDTPPEHFPVSVLRIRVPRDGAGLTHRDYLGSLMALGVKRECLGDIVPDEGGAYLCMTEKLAPLVCRELASVGRCSASAEVAEQGMPESAEKTGEEHTATVASLRLDAVLAAMLHTGRTAAAELVRSGAVLVNHMAAGSSHFEVCAGDVFTVRGRGKFKLTEVRGKSKKDRTFISFQQY